MLFCLMFLFAPAFGAMNEELLQDTLKSAVVSLMTMVAGLAYLGINKSQTRQFLWHPVVWLPLSMAIYALGSMVWSHTYLGGVETLRWLILSLILWLGMNIETPHLENRLLWGIHWGITIASCWAALQFWFDFHLFPQGPAPASTFVNRNFFAEYAVCALPYSVFLLLRSKNVEHAMLMAAMIGFNLVALMMTGTRSALIALIVFTAGSVILALWHRQIFRPVVWNFRQGTLISIVLIGTILSLGNLPSGNPTLQNKFEAANAIQRAIGRTASVIHTDEYTEGSFSIRTSMWASTIRMIQDNSLAGVGAGAWELFVPIYQVLGSPSETDYYAHNDVLQILAEYGWLGWIFWITLSAYLAYSAVHLLRNSHPSDRQFSLRSYAALSSIAMLLLVCNAGFPLRMACTGALFALSLGILAAGDLGSPGKLISNFTLNSSQTKGGLLAGTFCLVLGIFITYRAMESEKNIVRGVKLALAISRSGTANNPYWDEPKSQMRAYLQNGIGLNGHYRKLTAIAADEMARMSDWNDALWVWMSIHKSRPYILSIVINIARAHLELGNIDQAKVYFNKANQMQPSVPVVKLLEGQILAKTGHTSQAQQRIREVLGEQPKDHDYVRIALQVAHQMDDPTLLAETLELQRQSWPLESIEGFLQLGLIYSDNARFHDDAKAIDAFKNALRTTPNQYKAVTLAKVPQKFREKL